MRRRPTIIDVARVAGVSKTTVSRVVGGDGSLVREETRQKVLGAIEKLGYERNAVAGGLRTNRTYTIALIIPDIANPFWPEVARGVQHALEAKGYAVVLANSDWDARREHEFLAMARRNRFDGIIINPASVTNDELVACGIPAIILGGLGSEYSDFDMVGSDSYGGTALAMTHLVSLGHQRIGLISGLSRGFSLASRLDSYTDFLQQHDIPIEKDLIIKPVAGADQPAHGCPGRQRHSGHRCPAGGSRSGPAGSSRHVYCRYGRHLCYLRHYAPVDDGGQAETHARMAGRHLPAGTDPG